MVPSGYGCQTAQILPRFRDMGHLVAASAFYGVSGRAVRWEGFTVYPAGQAEYGTDVILPHAGHMKADLIITLMDFYKLNPIADQLAQTKVAAWLPNDCTPLGYPDKVTLKRSRAIPIAMSQFGLANLKEAGFDDALYVPHAIDTKVYKPEIDRKTLRQEIGIDDRFVIGICSANNDGLRKGYPEQFRAFSKFRAKHPEALLMVHAMVATPAGHNLLALAEHFGISGSVMFSDQYAQVAGLMSDEMQAGWFNALDVFSCTSYAEAFGIPIIEAQACGTPVIVTDGSAMSELCGSGWKVPGQEFWNPTHQAWWVRPNIDDIVKAYGKAYLQASAPGIVRGKAREFALKYDADKVAQEYWAPALKILEDS